MKGTITSLERHPVKGFTPEKVLAVGLAEGAGMPFDRQWAVEDGPSGFNPDAPAFVSKMKFTVLAKIPSVAGLCTRYDEETGRFHVSAPDGAVGVYDLSQAQGRAGLAAFLSAALAGLVHGPLKVVEGPGSHRFTDHPEGAISLVNLASVRDLEEKLGASVDPQRFRANIYIDGWPAWAEADLAGAHVLAGGAVLEGFKPIVRCAATHVNPKTAVRDLDVVRGLYDAYGHMNFGLYLKVRSGGKVAVGDPVVTS